MSLSPQDIKAVFSQIACGFEKLGDIYVQALLGATSVVEDAKPTPKYHREKHERDPNAPKKPMTSFLLFSQEKRSNIKTQYPELTNLEISKKLGQIWDTVDKRPYEDKARQLNEEYKILKEKYDKTKADDSESEGYLNSLVELSNPRVSPPKEPAKKKKKESIKPTELAKSTEPVELAKPLVVVEPKTVLTPNHESPKKKLKKDPPPTIVAPMVSSTPPAIVANGQDFASPKAEKKKKKSKENSLIN